jgi:hypothetical protein
MENFELILLQHSCSQIVPSIDLFLKYVNPAIQFVPKNAYMYALVGGLVE